MRNDTFLEAQTIPDLKKLKVQYKDNASVITLIDGVLAIKAKELQQAELIAKFTSEVDKLAETLPHPESVHNVYLAWREVEEDDTSQTQIEVEVVLTPSVVDDTGKITAKAVTGKELRYPKTKLFKWTTKVNATTQTAASGGARQSQNKRAITVLKRNGMILEKIGSYSSGKAACNALGIPCVGDSAIRVLTNKQNAYQVDDHDGIDAIIS